MGEQQRMIKLFFLGKSPWIGATISSLLGIGVESTGLTNSGNSAIFIGLCGLAGAFFASLPKIIDARSHAKLTESEFIGKETRQMIKTLRKQAVDNEQIIGLQVALRHTIQESYQAAVWRIDWLCDLAKRSHVTEEIPKYEPLNVYALIKIVDDQIKELRDKDN